MANTLGTLLVELGVNTAAFKKGLDAATYQAKQTAKEVKEAFEGIGDSIRELSSEFGAIGGQIGQLAGGVVNMVASFGGLEAPAAVVAGIGAAFAAAGIGALGAALHFSETAAKLHDLSQATGIATEDLSLLGSVAATKGIDLDSLAKGLEKMDKAALAAAQSGPKSSNAFKDLGIAVTNADGSMRQAKDIFDDVAKRFETLPDGPQKTAEAIKIFGRSGASLIPILNEGGAKLAEMEDHFRKLNAVVSTETADASNELQDTISVMGAAFKGVENTLTTELVPALLVVAKEFVAFFEENQTGIVAFATGIANFAKIFINAFQIIGDILADFFNAFLAVVQGMQTSFVSLGNASYDILHGNFNAAWQDIKKGAVDVKDGVVNNFKEMVNNIKSQGGDIAKIWEATLPPAEKRPSGGSDISKGADTSFIDKTVAALERQANKEAELAKAIGLVSTATIEANAAAEAGAAIDKIMEEARAKGIQNSAAFREELAKAIPQIQAATTWMAAFKAAIDTQKEFDNFDKKIHEQIAALAAAGVASTEVEKTWAKNNATLVPLQNNLAALTEEYNKLSSQPGTDPKKLAELGEKVSVLSTEYEKEAANVRLLNDAFQQSKAADEARKLESEFIKISGALDSLKSGDAFLNVKTQTQQWKDVLGLTDDQINKLIPDLEKLRGAQIAQGTLDAAKAIGFDPKTINTLNEEIDFLNKNWQQLGLSAEAYSLTLDKLTQQQADLQAKTGGFSSGIKAAFADLAAQGKSTGELIKDVTGTALKGFSDNFAAMVTDGKAKWADLLTSMEQMIVKSTINSLLANLFKKLSSSDDSDNGGGGSFLGSIFGGLFGGGHALGGGVVPNMSYLVGEKGPEIFTPSQAGSISPNGTMPDMGGTTIHNTWNINTPDADSFRKSKGQIMADTYAGAAAAAMRNR